MKSILLFLLSNFGVRGSGLVFGAARPLIMTESFAGIRNEKLRNDNGGFASIIWGQCP